MDAETRARLGQPKKRWSASLGRLIAEVSPNDLDTLLAAYDAQSTRLADLETVVRTTATAAAEAEQRLAVAEQALRWAVEMLDAYREEIPGTEHWTAGWADWLEQQARPALKGADDAGR